ncbi:symmetrical bis(5'-nucleosyl)-tetraphosphatase [Candidatus Nitrotoga sp. HW29]|uniref:symmetrical bis(5'-nucleosyl)-tetraphosphatase n=1 Tax=Candidatus Nitrotoga sp. HW29 TaxID=2886963 RepID=UPI001EF22851|nr:symmetrical bis(5'-nucleosyl)-tetraphosphatase [Candidatus Nitrotoga sp. HW29]
MATYAIGDIQGCYTELLRLLEQICFDPAIDRLWLVGDLVNRGPDSANVLRLIKSLGDAAITVLGNHDLHLLAVAEGAAKLHRYDTLHDILDAPDRNELLAWLRVQRLLYVEGDFVLVHAGLLPGWTVTQAQQLVHEVEAVLAGKHYHDFLVQMYGNHPDHWKDDLSGYKRLRVITNACTRIRVCTVRGEMEFKFKDEVHNIPEGYMPWFDVPGRASANATIVFGHWSALGLKVTPQIIALDTGCLWGGVLSAIRLEDRKLFQVPCVSIPIAKPCQ